MQVKCSVKNIENTQADDVREHSTMPDLSSIWLIIKWLKRFIYSNGAVLVITIKGLVYIAIEHATAIRKYVSIKTV